MRIGVNFLPFGRQMTGATRYAKSVLDQLSQVDGTNQYWVFVTARNSRYFSFESPRFSLVPCRVPLKTRMSRILWEQFVLPLQLNRLGMDVLFTPSVAVPWVSGIPKCTVIFDMIPFLPRVPKYSSARALYVRWATENAARFSQVVITPSETTKRDIVNLIGIPATRILVGPSGVDSSFTPVLSPESIRRCFVKHSLPKRYILYVGALEPGKNLVGVVRAFSQVKKWHPELDYKLVLAGQPSWRMWPLWKAIKESGIADEIIVTGYVAEEDLPTLYALATVFIFVSFYEGFGQPALEAMACGTPVIVSSVPALLEVVGDAGISVSPTDISAIAEAIEWLLTDQAARREFRRRGLERAKQFSWQKTGEVVLKGFYQAAHHG